MSHFRTLFLDSQPRPDLQLDRDDQQRPSLPETNPPSGPTPERLGTPADFFFAESSKNDEVDYLAGIPKLKIGTRVVSYKSYLKLNARYFNFRSMVANMEKMINSNEIFNNIFEEQGYLTPFVETHDQRTQTEIRYLEPTPDPIVAQRDRRLHTLKKQNKELKKKNSRILRLIEKTRRSRVIDRDLKSAGVYDYERLVHIPPNRLLRALFFRSQTREECEKIVALQPKLLNRFKYENLKRRKIVMKAARSSAAEFATVFRTEENFAKTKECVAVVFGRNLLRVASSEMLLWVNLHLDFSDCTVICGFADGKMSDCPGSWYQYFELRLMLANSSGLVRTVTFASALLQGKSTLAYKTFFDAVCCRRCPSPKILVTDFESAIGAAASTAWSQLKLRGCFVHFLRNVLHFGDEISGELGRAPSTGVMNLMFLLPFLRDKSFFLRAWVDRLRLSAAQVLENPDVRLCVYVFETYIEKFGDLFDHDLSALLVRCNNSAEGRNSGMARFFGFKPQYRQLAAHLEFIFTMDCFLPFAPPPAPSDLDRLLLRVQALSELNPDAIIRICVRERKIESQNAADVLRRLEVIALQASAAVTDVRARHAEEKMREFSARVRNYRADLKQMKAVFLSLANSAKRSLLASEEVRAGVKETIESFKTKIEGATNELIAPKKARKKKSRKTRLAELGGEVGRVEEVGREGAEDAEEAYGDYREGERGEADAGEEEEELRFTD